MRSSQVERVTVLEEVASLFFNGVLGKHWKIEPSAVALARSVGKTSEKDRRQQIGLHPVPKTPS
jgi:hypothetical protein